MIHTMLSNLCKFLYLGSWGCKWVKWRLYNSATEIKHKFLALELLLLTKSDNLTNLRKVLLGWMKMHQRIMWYTYEVCNKINLLKNVEKEVLMYSQIENSLLSNVVTKSNLQMQYLSPILRMLISQLKVHFFRCNFSHILILLWQPKKC